MQKQDNADVVTAEELDASVIETLDKYEAVVEEQEALNKLVKDGVLQLMRCKLMLDQLEARELCAEDYPDDAQAKVRVGKTKSGKIGLKVNAAARDPATYFARNISTLAEPQQTFTAALQAALRCATKRTELLSLAEKHAALRTRRENPEAGENV
ncbi:hypothetical protein DIPPA_08873 [Diplonema papillatum]|nr:hypothetical protein DIPPA_08873 [Diplonema papillatum]